MPDSFEFDPAPSATKPTHEYGTPVGTSGYQDQFLTEAVLLAGAGGIVGVGLGAGVTAVYAHVKHWTVVVPPVAIVGV